MVLFPPKRLLGSRASRRDGGEECLGDSPAVSSVHGLGLVIGGMKDNVVLRGLLHIRKYLPYQVLKNIFLCFS